MAATEATDVDVRDLCEAFEKHYRRGCVVCRDAPTGHDLCDAGVDLFNAMMGQAGLAPEKAN